MENTNPNQIVSTGRGEAFAAKKAWPSALIAMVGFLATAVLIV